MAQTKNEEDFLAWLGEAYARDAITLGALEAGVECVLSGRYDFSDYQPPAPWPDDPTIRGEFAYDA